MRVIRMILEAAPRQAGLIYADLDVIPWSAIDRERHEAGEEW